MDGNDTNLLIYHDTDLPEISPGRQANVENEKKKEGFQDLLDKIRFYNRQGPHYIYSERSDYDRKIKDHRRLIKKSGKYNVSRSVESQIWDKYLRDFCNTLVHSRWRWTVVSASSSFILSWLIFAVIWMLISNANGDAEIEDASLKCLVGINSFAGFFLFSLETQTSIGYGGRSAGDHCPEVLFVLCLQIIMGAAIGSLMINIVFLKLTKSQTKYSKLFSKHAVICRRDGELCLIFRVRDEDSRHAIGTTVTAYVLRRDKESGEPYLETIPLEPYGFLIWPLEIVHKITATSPLWDVSSYNLLSDKFEVIVTLQGTSPTTARCSKSRTSYVSSEILWGHKFKNCIKFAKKENAYVVNEKNFNATEEYSTHLCSAKRFAEVYSSLSPTPRNFRLKLNIIYNGNQRRGTLMSIESIDSSKCDEQSEISKDTKEKANNSAEAINKQRGHQQLENSLKTKSLSGNNYNLNPISSSKNENMNSFKYDDVDNFQSPYNKDWDYQNYSGDTLPNFWLKETASLPLINNYDQDHVLRSRQFGSDIQNLRMNELLAGSSNLSEGKGLLTDHKVFEGEEFIYENVTSPEHSNMSLISENQKGDGEFEHDAELDAMLKAMETYLQENSNSKTSSIGFPKINTV